MPEEATPKPANPKPPAEPKPPKPGEPAPPPQTPAEPTEEQRKAIAEAAVAEFQRKQTAADEKRKREAEAKAAEERGEFDKVKASLEARAVAAELRERKAEARIALRDYLGDDEKRRAYLPSATWIEKAVDITADTDPKDVPGLVKTAADKFITDNPREAPKQPPGAGARGREEVRGMAVAAVADKEKNNNGGRKPLSIIGRGF